VATDFKGWGNMPKYFFVVRQGDQTSDESDGIEFHDISAVQLEAIKSTGEILRDFNYPIEAGLEWRMEVVDEARKPLFSLRVIAELHE
jgi:TATA-binding protein-associated factor Taf7